MIANSEFIILLRQGDSDVEVIQRVLGLNNNTINYVMGSELGCGVMKFGNRIIPFDNTIPKDCLLYDIVNTDFHEKVRKRKLSGKQRKELRKEATEHPVPYNPMFDLPTREEERIDIADV